MSVLTLENINFSYGKTAVLNDVSFDFEKGKMYCITGKSGAGKTTLLSILSGLAHPKAEKSLITARILQKLINTNSAVNTWALFSKALILSLNLQQWKM